VLLPLLNPKRVSSLGAVDLLGADDEMLAHLLSTCSVLQECAAGAPEADRRLVFGRFASLLWAVRSHDSSVVRRAVVGGFASCVVTAARAGWVASRGAHGADLRQDAGMVEAFAGIHDWAVGVARRDRDASCREAARELAAAAPLR